MATPPPHTQAVRKLWTAVAAELESALAAEPPAFAQGWSFGPVTAGASERDGGYGGGHLDFIEFFLLLDLLGHPDQLLLKTGFDFFQLLLLPGELALLVVHLAG